MKGLEFWHKLAEEAPEQLHRYTLDWQRQERFGDQAVKKWEEIEPGSIKTVLNAYARAIPWISQKKKLSSKDFKTIQNICASHHPGVFVRGEFRVFQTYFYVTNQNATEAGTLYFINQYRTEMEPGFAKAKRISPSLTYTEFAEKEQHPSLETWFTYLKEKQLLIFHAFSGDLTEEETSFINEIGYLVYPGILTGFFSKYPDLKQTFYQTNKKEPFLNRVLNSQDVNFSELIQSYITYWDTDNFLDKKNVKRFNALIDKLHHAIEEDISTILDQCYKQLNADNLHDDEKLYIIADTIRRLEQMHPFQDMNCRTFCMVFLNVLLIQNDFLPALIDDPNKFDGYDTHSLVQVIKEGIERSEILNHYITPKDTHRTLSIFSNPQEGPEWCHVPEHQKKDLAEMAGNLTETLYNDKNPPTCCPIS
ncbi:MAG: hypothetical protein CK424_02860 [Legionella sp.]|nr:MAG: hypothetical protein CK424_02860 [Legionella sp.]